MSAERPHQEAREEVALACRVLARHKVLDGVLGHVSRPVPGGMLLRSFDPDRAGLWCTKSEDVLLYSLDGELLEEDHAHRLPSEHPIHGEVLKALPDVGCVIHAHPHWMVACEVAGVPIRPIVGAFNIIAMRLTAGGLPVHDCPGLITTAPSAAPVVAALADHGAVLLYGHGVVVVGDDVPQATIRAVELERLAQLCLEVAKAGGRPRDMNPVDLVNLPNLGPRFEAMLWSDYERADTLDLALARLALGEGGSWI